MELAVNMPEQEPQVGQALASSWLQFGLGHLAALHLAHAFEDGDQVAGAAVQALCRPAWGRR